MKLARGIGIFVLHVGLHPLQALKGALPSWRRFFEGIADGTDPAQILEDELRRRRGAV